MNYCIVICDDETLALRINKTVIETLVEQFKLQATIKTFNNCEDLIAYHETNEIHIAFLDIKMKTDQTGISCAKQLRAKNPDIVIIFITGEIVSPVEVFKVQAFGYVQKPLDPEVLKIDFKRALNQARMVRTKTVSEPLVITEENIKKKIRQSNIVYIEKVQLQSKIHMLNSDHYVYETVKSLESRLESSFVQVNQSVIVNLDWVAKVERDTVYLKSNEEFSIGRRYKKDVVSAYNNYIIR